MNNELQNELLSRLDLLTDKIGQTGAQLFQSYIGTVQIQPWILLTFGIICFFIAIIFIFLCIWAFKKERAEDKSNSCNMVWWHIPAQVFGGVIGGTALVFALILCCEFINKIPNIYYPEKAAFQELMKDLGQIKN